MLINLFVVEILPFTEKGMNMLNTQAVMHMPFPMLSSTSPSVSVGWAVVDQRSCKERVALA